MPASPSRATLRVRLCVVSLALAAPASATDWYVSPTGSDTNDGRSPSAAFATIQRGIDAAQPGDTVQLAAGTYAQNVRSVRSGLAGSPITLRGPREAVVTGCGCGADGNRIVEINHSFITVDGFTIDGLWRAPGSSASDYRDKLLYVLGKQARSPGGPAAIDGLRVVNLALKNAGGECLRLRYFVKNAEVAFNTITTCGVVDFRFGGGGKNGEAIYVGTSNTQWADGKNPNANPDESTNNWIHHNGIDTDGNECVDLKEGTYDNIIENNDCTGQRDPDSGGFDSRGDKNVFRYNTVYSNTGAGVRLGGCSPSPDCPRQYGLENDVYENTISNNAYGAIKVMFCPQRKICGNVLAGNGSGKGACGATYDYEASCTVVQPPPAPSGLAATAGKKKVSLSWTAAAGATSYNVKRSTTSGGPYATIASGVTATSYTNTGLRSGTTYHYVVSALNAGGESPDSNQASATAR
jgi:hypothetical protein